MVSEEKWNNKTNRLERIDLYEAWFHQFGNDECGENVVTTIAIVERIDNGQVEVVFPGNIRFVDQPQQQEKWPEERTAVVALLREICQDHGDNDWPDNLHIYDIIEKHLLRNIERRE